MSEAMTTSSLGTLDFLKYLGASREACLFAERDATFDVTLVCHEARSVEIGNGEQLFVSVRVAQKFHAEEARAPIGTACQLKAVELDSALLLFLWASSSIHDEAVRRACGELRIPLHRLATNFYGMLYQTWVTLDLPGLNDSVASIGLTDEDAAFDQRLVEGARQHFQPRICLSICKTSELPASGKLLLQVDAAETSRCNQWGPLLKSQQQHSVLSKVLHLHISTAVESPDAVEQTARTSQKLREAQGRAASQLTEVTEMRRRLEEANAHLAEERAAAPRRSTGTSLAAGAAPPPFKEHGEEDAASAQWQLEVERLRQEVGNVSLEANGKIDAANDRIRTLRRERDDARQEAERMRAEVTQLNDQQAQLSEETHELSEQIQALLRIVEDLHQACMGDQVYLDNMRQSIDSITRNFRLT